jgi:hypothetical protein
MVTNIESAICIQNSPTWLIILSNTLPILFLFIVILVFVYAVKVIRRISKIRMIVLAREKE